MCIHSKYFPLYVSVNVGELTAVDDDVVMMMATPCFAWPGGEVKKTHTKTGAKAQQNRCELLFNRRI